MLFIPITVYKPFSNLSFFFFIKYLALGRASHLLKLYITNVCREEKPRHFLIYHYITA